MVVYPDTSPIILTRSQRLKDRFSEGVETVILDHDRLGNKGFWEPGSVHTNLRLCLLALVSSRQPHSRSVSWPFVKRMSVRGSREGLFKRQALTVHPRMSWNMLLTQAGLELTEMQLHLPLCASQRLSCGMPHHSRLSPFYFDKLWAKYWNVRFSLFWSILISQIHMW